MSDLTSGQARALRTSCYLSLIYFTILYYDHLLTFSAEVRLFWSRRRLSWPSALFFINRYGALLGHVLCIIGEFMYSDNDEFCFTLHEFYQLYVGFLQLVIFGLCIMRVSAIYNHNRLVIGYLLVVVLASIALYCWFYASGLHQGAQLLRGRDVVGCHLMFPQSQGARLAVPWFGVLFFDCSIFVLTTAKAFRIGRQYPLSVVRALLRDGTLCFIVLFLANFANILMCLLAPPILKSMNTLLTTVMSTIAMSRMMLDLRAADARLKLRNTRESNFIQLESHHPRARLHVLPPKVHNT